MIKLILGDCLEEMPKLEAGSVDLILADPPYGIDYQSARRTDKDKWFDKIENDEEPFLDWIEQSVRLLKPTGCILCFCRWDVQEVFKEEISKYFTIKSQVIWDRVIHGMGDLKGAFSPQHDVIWFATNKDFSFPNKRPSSVIKIQRLSADKLTHPTEKPLALYRRLINSTTKKGDVVLDPTFGSGVAAEACFIEDRNFIGIEKDLDYFAIAEKRIAAAQPALFA